MKRRSQNNSERGIALVITLVMLAIVTLMAIVFLAISRRERSSVRMMEDLATSGAMADAAAERAKAQAIADMAANGSKLYYDLFNSQAFGNTRGFNTSQAANSDPDPNNVSYYDRNGSLLSGPGYLRMLANLQYDPRVPVFVETNSNGNSEFRFFLDFDRNRLFETNGIVPVLDDNGRVIVNKGVTNVARFVGDPEWIGVLERPDLPHSETNRFIGRLAYMVLPAGKTLDLNFIHNQVQPSAAPNLTPVRSANGFSRNQGVGSWEINLAAFLRELNPTNYAWDFNSYHYPGGTQLPTGAAFDNARALLAVRYPVRSLLKAASVTLASDPENLNNPNDFQKDMIDNYGDGPVPVPRGQIFFSTNLSTALPDNDQPADRPWPGSFNTNAFTDIQQVFNVGSGDFTNRLQAPLRKNSSFDRYQFYRLASQLGVDSTPAIAGKLNLNYENAVGKATNTFRTWTNALAFFTTAADLMLKASIDRVVTISNRNDIVFWGRQPGTYYLIGDTLVSTNFSVNNLQVVGPPTAIPSFRQSEYTPTIHRILQVAANIYDNMTNRAYAGVQNHSFPTVFRPIYSKTNNSVVIRGWKEVVTAGELAGGWKWDLEQARTNVNVFGTNDNFFGQHLVIGAKKGQLNFNELALQNTVEISRKIEVGKASATAPSPNETNQMFLVSLEQRWGMEAWNSYTNDYKRDTVIVAEVLSTVAIKDGTNLVQPPIQMWTTRARPLTPTGIMRGSVWPGYSERNPTNFTVVIQTNFNLLQDVAYTKLDGFRRTNIAQFRPIETTPKFVVTTTNKVRYFVVDGATQRILDFVSFDNLVTTMDVSKELYVVPPTPIAGTNDARNEDIYWDPTVVSGSGLNVITKGITNQLAVSSGDLNAPPSLWAAFRFSDQGDKNGAISAWRKFVGLKLFATNKNVGPLPDLKRQTPFVPSRRIEQLVSWQANDPLVHYMPQDLTRARNADLPRKRPITQQGPSPWSIGKLNDRYRPWGGSASEEVGGTTGDALAYSVAVKDPGIRRSDDWEFPINEAGTNRFFFANVGALGRVHRGTPWQTLYLKSIYTLQSTATGTREVPLVDPMQWRNWAGSAGTFPTHDWKLVDVFTTAANENATRGLLSVNQTNRAAWSAVLSGVLVATNTIKNTEARNLGDENADPVTAYQATLVEPATLQVAQIVDSINFARQRQLDIIPNPNLAANPTATWVFDVKKNVFTGKTNAVFERMGDILSAPHLTVQSPYLNYYTNQIKSVLTDRALEYIPQQILSLLKKDEPRFVVYAYGQSLKPAPRSLTSDPNFYHMCTNYQITGEVTTKTVFRVEGDLPDPRNPFTQNNPLRAVVESYEVLPPAE